jgi:class 3 adenylate cyclase
VRRITRTDRLAAIVAADVAGSSAMMERDEEGTARMRRRGRKVIAPALAHYQGAVSRPYPKGFQCWYCLNSYRVQRTKQPKLQRRSVVAQRLGVCCNTLIVEL